MALQLLGSALRAILHSPVTLHSTPAVTCPATLSLPSALVYSRSYSLHPALCLRRAPRAFAQRVSVSPPSLHVCLHRALPLFHLLSLLLQLLPSFSPPPRIRL
ncbi:hypothetical protein B0H14DRAFT_3486117 [Mycena olivaceomarginata]|nr:hypothetical protein B0H14DRAFT_3486117 [Mycena olivaceomarginata]